METEPVKADQLRPLLQNEIQEMDERGLAMMHRVLLQLRAERLAEELTDAFSKEENLPERIDRAISDFRKAHPYK
jgi:hypothetical protein